MIFAEAIIHPDNALVQSKKWALCPEFSGKKAIPLILQEDKGESMVPQVGLEPTTLGLTGQLPPPRKGKSFC